MGWYNHRGESSENRIKELKIGFGMERMPCDSFKANAMFFRTGVLAYNLYVLFRSEASAGELVQTSGADSSLATLFNGGKSYSARGKCDIESE